MENNLEIEISGLKYKYYPLKQLNFDIYGYSYRSRIYKDCVNNFVDLYGHYSNASFKNVTYHHRIINFDDAIIQINEKTKSYFDVTSNKFLLNCEGLILENLLNRFKENKFNNEIKTTIIINFFNPQTAFANYETENLILLTDADIKRYGHSNKNLINFLENNLKQTQIIDWKLEFFDMHIKEKKSFFNFLKF